jgi:hypothetical protein
MIMISTIVSKQQGWSEPGRLPLTHAYFNLVVH